MGERGTNHAIHFCRKTQQWPHQIKTGVIYFSVFTARISNFINECCAVGTVLCKKERKQKKKNLEGGRNSGHYLYISKCFFNMPNGTCS